VNADLLPGHPYPLGATVRDHPRGVNFSIFSKNCAAMELLLFDRHDDRQPARAIPLDPLRNRTFYYWHVFVPNIGAGQLYGYRAHGPFNPERGLRFDGTKVLIDPYTRAAMYAGNYSREAAKRPGDNCAQAIKSVVVDSRAYKWEGDTPLHRPYAGSVIYEMHVGGFTRHPSSGVDASKRGTYAGLVEKIPYLQELGVTTVELLPIQQFDEQDAPPGLKNYWGYQPVAFFAPHRGYSARADPLGPVDEFRDMVKALHRAGIEVILDVVFNHTTEGDHAGPTLSFRGLENRAYYILQSHPALYADYTGCGNTVNGNHSVVRRMIVDCLRYWVQAMHVDGFRFDLASVLARDEWGQPLRSPPIIWEIESDPVLAGTKIIAEAWDAAGLYQVGSFVGHRWAEWNGQYRDDVRRFVKGESGAVRKLADRITASPDLYPQPDREPNRSINFVTSHDGFTLHDLVSYNRKRNDANGHANTDGTDANFSWNCGDEGPAKDRKIEALRYRQMKNLISILLVSQGTPMLLMGDEVRRTQRGNNNAYCQDNEIGWLDWRGVQIHADMLRFVREMIRFNRDHHLFQQESFWTNPGSPDVLWHGIHLYQPDWGHASHSLAFELRAADHPPGSPAAGRTADDEHLHVMLNAYWEPLTFDLPPLSPEQRWCRVVDTALPSPEDISEPGKEPPVAEGAYRVEARSVVILKAQ
jgi:glycogen operon protein